MEKKIIILIVEGPSDQDALEAIFEKIFERNDLRVHVVHGDITTQKIPQNSNMSIEINNIVEQFIADNHLTRNDIQQIIHIVDMDGAFVPDSYITKCDDIADDNNTHIIYTLKEIKTNKPENVIIRNKIKRDRINEVSRKKEIASTPYQVYYMSYCLDHVLYNKLNSSDEEKDIDSTTFALKYKDNIEEFKNYLTNSSFSVKGDYLSTWRFIKENGNSLMRYTNLWICWNNY